MKRLFRLTLLWLPVILWCGFIYFLSSIPRLSSGLEYDFILRKTAHVCEYAILALLLWRAIRKSINQKETIIFFLVLLFCILYALSDEWHQSFIDGRVASLRDIFIDSFSVLLFCIFRLKRHIHLRSVLKKISQPKNV